MSLLREDDPRFRPAMQLMEDAEYAEALRQLDAQLPQLSGEDRLVALYWKARTLESLTEWSQARTSVDEALKEVDEGSKLSICLKIYSAFLLNAEERPGIGASEVRSLIDHFADELKTPDLLRIYVKAKKDLGSLLVNAGRYSEAIVELEEALSFEDRPLQRYYIYLWLGWGAHRAGNLDKAKDYFEAAVVEAQTAPAKGIDPSLAADLRYNLALIAYTQRRHADARHELELATALPFEDQEVSQLIGKLKAYLDLAESYKESVGLLRENDPRFRPAMQFTKQANYDEALRQLDALLAQLSGEDRLAALHWRANTLKALGERKHARTCLDQALKQAKPNSYLFVSLKILSASLLHIEKGPAEAAAEIRSIFDRYSEELKSPDLYWTFVRAKSDLGHFLLLAGRYSEAIKELEQALFVENRPLARYYIYFWIGLAANDLGDLDKGKDYLERALRQAESAPAEGIFPVDAAKLRYNLALIAYKQERLADARREIESAAEIPVTDEGLSKAIVQLQRNLDRPDMQ